jgi:two-component system sensor histidine kinase KdpD
VLQATERLQTALLNSISHDLRTPLVSITGALSSLQEDGSRLDGPTQRALVDNAREEAERLNRLVGNLLDMTRLEAGAVKVKREPVDVADLVGSALQQLAPQLASRPVDVGVPNRLPPVSADFVLILQVLVNVLDNALKYSPPEAAIALDACRLDDSIQIAVADQGPGIPPADLSRIFDKFYRVQGSGKITGTGLGLSICKGILEAHGGRIWAENRLEGGARICLVLPLAGKGAEPHD